jgi:hypothetical protein
VKKMRFKEFMASESIGGGGFMGSANPLNLPNLYNPRMYDTGGSLGGMVRQYTADRYPVINALSRWGTFATEIITYFTSAAAEKKHFSDIDGVDGKGVIRGIPAESLKRYTGHSQFSPADIEFAEKGSEYGPAFIFRSKNKAGQDAFDLDTNKLRIHMNGAQMKQYRLQNMADLGDTALNTFWQNAGQSARGYQLSPGLSMGR